MKTTFLLFLSCIIVPFMIFAQGNHLAPGNGNPLIPGYFADPTIKKFGDTWYIYALPMAIMMVVVRQRYGLPRILSTGP